MPFPFNLVTFNFWRPEKKEKFVRLLQHDCTGRPDILHSGGVGCNEFMLPNAPIILASMFPVVAFHPRPQIASDLGRNVTRSFNPHRNRNQFPSGNEILAYGRRFKSQPASTRCDLRIASPTRPFLQVI